MMVFVSLKSLADCKGPRGLGGMEVFLDLHLQVTGNAHTNFLSDSRGFYPKNRDKFGWVKHWVFPCQNFALYGILIACTHVSRPL